MKTYQKGGFLYIPEGHWNTRRALEYPEGIGIPMLQKEPYGLITIEPAHKKSGPLMDRLLKIRAGDET